MYLNSRKYIPSISTALIGLAIFILVPFQIDLSMVNGNNVSGVDARTLPYFLSSLIVLLSVVEIINIKRKERVEEYKKMSKTQYMNIFRVCLTFIAIVLWIVLVPYLGFIIAMIILLVSVMLLMGNRSWLQIILVPLLTSFLLNYVFTTFLGRTLPTGIFF
ncbi:tricarboxylate transport protein TctB [Gracilibacillus boraciitolerans JCM 21714]|uniref:Tricarboxylate transport protein TctB n=1 Tax=Gracilibacillus boraciitolerans JCM 21714 TaxID=1298598 RepID=W4VP11_9BACI|nr:tripartite tricarboxylate transporter TctB family protein [Gracilibacillus boraciitolerans]GAE94479.1 tricarboxylate transport protein TctB [Gracilibacillus boraciitolerans JCM 21714]